MPTTPAADPVPAVAPPRVGRYRWVICPLLFAATAFQFAYAIGYVGFGRIVDVIGARAGYIIAILIWTVSQMAHGLATSITTFAMARFGLDVGEAGNFPAGIKTVTEWFPQRECAYAIGLFNAGANVGAIVTPLLVPFLVLTFDWRVAFYVTGVFGVLWLIAWLALHRHPDVHPHVSAAELAYIRQDPADPVAPLSWSRVATFRETWAYAAWQVLHRSDLVVLLVLAARLSVRPLSHGPEDVRPAPRRDLPYFRFRQHCRRLVVITTDRKRADPQFLRARSRC